MIGPGEAFIRRAVPPKEVGLPRRNAGNTGNLVCFRLIRDRVCRLRRSGGHNQIHFVFEYQIRGYF
jgi:hypothetical protein